MREPKVSTEDLRRILIENGITNDLANKGSVQAFAVEVGCSPRTIYRVLNLRKPGTELDLADRILMALDLTLRDCELIFEDG